MTRIIQEREAEALLKFRERISDLLPSFSDYKSHDIWLLRWLRDKELNIDRAEWMLRKTLKWREMNQMDEIQSWKVPDYVDINIPIKVPGFDKDGCVFGIVPFGHWDLKKVIAKGHSQDFIRFAEQLLETCYDFLEQSTTKDKYLSKFALVLDFDGFSLTQLMSKDVIQLVMELLSIYKAHYPETLKAGWIVNAPKYFDLFFTLIRPLFTARTLTKLHVYGRRGWRSELLKEIDPDQLPSHYGGSNTTCPEYKSRYGYDVFKTHETFPESQFKQKLLGGGSKHLEIHELTPGDKMSWNFRTDDHDLAYTVQFEGSLDKELKILFSCDRADSHLHTQKGEIQAENPGTYTLILENLHGPPQNVYYAVQVTDTVDLIG